MSKKTVGVVGFYFNKDITKVALINKLEPEWQRGKLNGIGGKLEPEDKGSFNAMIREAFEEADIATGGWFEIETVQFDKYTLHVFAGRGEEEIRTKTKEQVAWYDLNDLEKLLQSDALVEGVYNYIQKAKLALI